MGQEDNALSLLRLSKIVIGATFHTSSENETMDKLFHPILYNGCNY